MTATTKEKSGIRSVKLEVKGDLSLKGWFSDGGYTMETDYWNCEIAKAGAPILVWHQIKPIVHVLVPDESPESVKEAVKRNLLYLLKFGNWGGVGRKRAIEMEIVAVETSLCVVFSDSLSIDVPDHISAGQRVDVVATGPKGSYEYSRGYIVNVGEIVSGELS